MEKTTLYIDGDANPREARGEAGMVVWDPEARAIRSWCKKCGTQIRLDMVKSGTDQLLTVEEAAACFKRLDESGPWECPGYHVELSAMGWHWNFPEALELYRRVREEK